MARASVLDGRMDEQGKASIATLPALCGTEGLRRGGPPWLQANSRQYTCSSGFGPAQGLLQAEGRGGNCRYWTAGAPTSSRASRDKCLELHRCASQKTSLACLVRQQDLWGADGGAVRGSAALAKAALPWSASRWQPIGAGQHQGQSREYMAESTAWLWHCMHPHRQHLSYQHICRYGQLVQQH